MTFMETENLPLSCFLDWFEKRGFLLMCRHVSLELAMTSGPTKNLVWSNTETTFSAQSSQRGQKE